MSWIVLTDWIDESHNASCPYFSCFTLASILGCFGNLGQVHWTILVIFPLKDHLAFMLTSVLIFFWGLSDTLFISHILFYESLTITQAHQKSSLFDPFLREFGRVQAFMCDLPNSPSAKTEIWPLFHQLCYSLTHFLSIYLQCPTPFLSIKQQNHISSWHKYGIKDTFSINYSIKWVKFSWIIRVRQSLSIYNPIKELRSIP